MKKLVYVFVIIFTTIFVSGCKNPKPAPIQLVDTDSVAMQDVETDSTIYGVCGGATAMHSLEMITDQGDTTFYLMNLDEKADVQGGLMQGDRIALIAKKNADGEDVAQTVINLTTLLGKWTSLDKNFEIVEGGKVESSVKAETNPWTSWKILNGKLLLNTDTFSIVELGADSMYLENDKGIFAYKRQSK